MMPDDEMAVKHQICEGTVDNARATSETMAAVNTLNSKISPRKLALNETDRLTQTHSPITPTCSQSAA